MSLAASVHLNEGQAAERLPKRLLDQEAVAAHVNAHRLTLTLTHVNAHRLTLTLTLTHVNAHRLTLTAQLSPC